MKRTLRQVFARPWVNSMLVFVPFGIAAHAATLNNQTIVFGLNALAVVPLTALLTFATENAALRLGNGTGALLNITFGNLVELVILSLLLKNHLRIIISSLLGSILVNVLFILGISFMSAGLRYREQIYDRNTVQMLLYFMTTGVLSMLIPTSLHACINKEVLADALTLKFSRGIALTLLFIYALFVHFQLRSQPDHHNMPEAESGAYRLLDEEAQRKGYSTVSNSAEDLTVIEPSPVQEHSGLALFPQYQSHDEFGSKTATACEVSIVEEPEEEALGTIASLTLLIISAGLVSLCAEYMVSSIEHVIADAPLTEAFLGLIILPLLGNAAEMATAVTLALRDKVQLAITITVGSAIQISLFMAPAIVLLGWSIGKDLSLYFDMFQIVGLLATLLMVNVMLLSGRCHYLFGILLCACYVVIGTGAFFMPNRHRVQF